MAGCVEVRHVTAYEVRSIVLDPWVYDRITHDGCPQKEDFVFPEEGCEYIGGYVEGRTVSAYIIHAGEAHFMVLKNYRQYAEELFEQSFKLAGKSVTVQIPSLYRSVINFAHRMGFKPVECDVTERMKGGVSYPLVTLRREA